MAIATTADTAVSEQRRQHPISDRATYIKDQFTLHARDLIQRGVVQKLIDMPPHDNLMRLTTVTITDKAHWAFERFGGIPLIEGDNMPTTFDEKLRLITEICNGVAYLHAQGIIHRDLRPHNVWRAEIAKVGDLNAADAMETRQTQRHTDLLDVNWIAPEQADINEPIMPTMDIYSLGLLCIFVLTEGQIDPGMYIQGLEEDYVAQTVGGMLTRHFGEEASQVLLTAIRQSPGERYQDVPTFFSALSLALQKHHKSQVAAQAV